MYNCDDPISILLATPFDYTVEMAFDNNDILNTPTAKSINTGRLNLFIQNVNNGIPDCVFITTFGIDGPAATSILKYDGNEITYYVDNSRYSNIPGDLKTYKIIKLYTDISNFPNMIVTNYHAVSSENIDFIVFRDIIFIKVKRPM